MNTAGTNTATHRSPAANAAPKFGHALRRSVLDGLRAGEFCIAYQGIYRVNNGELAQMEALIRWNHPEYGLLLPGAFCDSFADPEVIDAVTWFVMDTVARDIATWQHGGGARYAVAVNVPPSVAVMPGFTERVASICDTHDIPMECIEIELSESEDLARYPSIKGVVQHLRALGVNIAMDDFGTGYACLAALGPIEFGTVKIAKELLKEAPQCPNARMVFSSVLALMTRLNVTVVVEGVETAAQAQWLAQWPHVMAQGFFLARPTFGIDKVPGVKRARAVIRRRSLRHEHQHQRSALRFADAA
jgi:EAL domain-containing protein (putative c-di-GMP-specific phosphodiesterase class I)